MNSFRTRPLDNYIFEAEWQQLFVLTEHWKSDLLFYQDDLKFLSHLINKYFMWLSKAESIDIVVNIESGLIEMDKQVDRLVQRVNKHLAHLSELMDDPFKYDSHTFREEHQQLENDISKFVKDFRQNRKQVFQITEQLIDSKEIERRILT